MSASSSCRPYAVFFNKGSLIGGGFTSGAHHLDHTLDPPFAFTTLTLVEAPPHPPQETHTHTHTPQLCNNRSVM
ncbi:hypothetical protein JOQ06_018544, partial [Pogonophryne albipinna]